MKTTGLLLLLFALVCAASSARSQTPAPEPSKPEMPAGPCLRSAPDHSHWEITFSYPDEEVKKPAKGGAHKPRATPTAAAQPTRLRKVAVTKAGRITHEEDTDTASQVTDTWYEGGTQYTKFANDAIWYTSDAGAKGTSPRAAYHPLPASGFRDLDSVKEENYAGTTTYEDKKCLVFTPGGAHDLDLSKPAEAEKKLKTLDSVAYVNAESRLPVALQTPESVRKFVFDPTPVKSQELPADLVQQLKNGEEGNIRLSQPAPRPY